MWWLSAPVCGRSCQGDAIGWGVFGLVFGGIVGLAGGGGVLGFAEHAVVTGILWALFGVVAGTLYGLWAGRAVSARRIKPLRPLLPPDTSIALCWAEGAVSHDRIAEWSTPATDQLIMQVRVRGRRRGPRGVNAMGHPIERT